MIRGIGTDIVHIPRVEKLLKRFGQRFIDKVFHLDEQQSCRARFASQNEKAIACFYAKRFAAKEAYVKALGTGFGGQISLSDICVCNNESGQPYIKGSNGMKVHLSMSDDYPYATAMVVLEEVS